MRLAVQRGALLLAVYVAAVAALAWWLRDTVDDAARAVMDDTARLVASEVAAALDESVVTGLLQGAPADRLRLLNQTFEFTRRSTMVRSLQVVDAKGEVFASDEFIAVGRSVEPPEEIFGSGHEPRLLAEVGTGPVPRSYVLAVPLQRAGALVGYLRLELDSSRAGELYAQMRRRLLQGALGGLLLVAGVAYALHVQLRHRTAQLVAALERAAAGAPTDDATREEFAPAVAVAGRLGRELQAERARSEKADRRLQQLAELVDVGLLRLAGNGAVEFWTERARQLFGLPAGPSAEDWRRALLALEGILQSAPADRAHGMQTDIEVQRQGKPRRIRCQVYPLDDEGSAGYLVQARDREPLQAIETDLRMAAQQRALNRVYRGVAHDLRAPLNAMVLNLELLKRSLDPETPKRDDMVARQAKWVGVIEQEVHRLRRALEVLLAQTAPPSEKPEPFDLRGVIEEIHALLFPQARQQRVELVSHVPESEVTVVAHRDQIKQSVLNIAINGLEAMPEGGTLTLTLERDDARAVMRVADQGPGIPAELLDRIFDMHFTTKESGTGIGLYVARSMFEAQGGTVGAAASGPQGTTFELVLPLDGPSEMNVSRETT
jgi:signal transduction histidine kinase